MHLLQIEMHGEKITAAVRSWYLNVSTVVKAEGKCIVETCQIQ